MPVITKLRIGEAVIVNGGTVALRSIMGRTHGNGKVEVVITAGDVSFAEKGDAAPAPINTDAVREILGDDDNE